MNSVSLFGIALIIRVASVSGQAQSWNPSTVGRRSSQHGVIHDFTISSNSCLDIHGSSAVILGGRGEYS
jgi:hypothetical protein